MPRRHLWFSLALMLVLFLPISSPNALAAVGFQPISPDELKMTSEPLAPGAPDFL